MDQLNVEKERHNLLEDKISKSFKVMNISKYFLNRAQAAQEIFTRITKWNHVKLKSSAQQKEKLTE